MLVQVGLFIVTLGLYAFYWHYSTLKELHVANGKSDSPVLWTFLLIVPIAQLFSYWHYGSELEEFTNEKYPAIVVAVMWFIFSPIVWFLSQLELNKVAKQISA